MAIPIPTVPSTVTAVSAVSLNSTQNNKAFYINSGLIAADNTETTVISVNDIGKRDIIFWANVVMTSDSGDNMTMKVKSNGIIIYQIVFDITSVDEGRTPICFILPANTSLQITFTNQDTTVHNVGISAYGYYLEH